MKPLLYVMDAELSALYGLFNDVLNIESVSSTLYPRLLSSFSWSIIVPCIILFLQNPLVTNHCLQVICQTSWHGDIRAPPWSVSLFPSSFPVSFTSSCTEPHVCFPECAMVSFFFAYIFSFVHTDFPLPLFLSPSGDLTLGWWAPVSPLWSLPLHIPPSKIDFLKS